MQLPSIEYLHNKSKLLFQSLEIKGRLETLIYKTAESFGTLRFVLKQVISAAREVSIILCAPELAWLVALPKRAERRRNTNQVNCRELNMSKTTIEQISEILGSVI